MMNNLLFIDESSYFFQKDFLVQKIKETEGVPKFSYVVRDSQVFVFDALVKKVTERLLSEPKLRLEKLAHEVLPNAWVTANEAVSQFGVTPVPYKKFEIDGSLAILHEPFNALLPPRFNTESDRDRSLAQLLLGEVLAGDGEFNFKGQNMTMLEPLSLETLPVAPNLALSAYFTETLDDYYACLQTVSYELGFPILSEAEFKAIKSLEIDWAKAKSIVKNEVYSNCDRVWDSLNPDSFGQSSNQQADCGTDESNGQLTVRRTTAKECPPQQDCPNESSFFPRESTVNLDWSNLDEDDPVSEEGQEELFELRRLYPELNSLSDGTLYNWFDAYQNDCNYIKGWSPYREDGFLFYLLGLLVVDRSLDGHEIRAVGEVVGFELLQGFSLNSALQTGKIWWDYDRSLRQLTWRIYCIMEFLKQNRESQLQGSPVTTFTDIVTAFRKPGIQALTNTQF